MKSWQTTISGMMAAIGVIVLAASAFFDGDPDTKPVMSEVMASVGVLAGILGIGWFARDNNKSSEEAGAK